MKHFIGVTRKSGNRKIGAIPASWSTVSTCPDTCGLKKPLPGKKAPPCYYFSGHFTGMQAKRLENPDSTNRLTPKQFAEWVATLNPGQLWRDRVGGDQVPSATKPLNIDARTFNRVTRANHQADARGFSYTHYPLNAHNVRLIRAARLNGYTLNVSADSMAEAAKIKSRFPDLPVVALGPADYEKGHVSGDVQFVQCPATYVENMDCQRCKVCAYFDRKAVIVFPAHGKAKRSAEIIATSNELERSE